MQMIPRHVLENKGIYVFALTTRGHIATRIRGYQLS